MINLNKILGVVKSKDNKPIKNFTKKDIKKETFTAKVKAPKIIEEHFEVVKPQYKVIQVKSHKSIRNYTSSNIAKCISQTYRTINKRIKINNRKLYFEKSFKISYCIELEESNANFYFIVPDVFMGNILEKINEIWSKATVTIVEKDILRPFSDNAKYYQLYYKKEDAMSINVDRKTNDPLNSILSVVDYMKEDDRVMLFCNFIPCSQMGWLDRYTDTVKRYKERKSIEKKQVSFESIVRTSIYFIIKAYSDVLQVVDDLTGGSIVETDKNLYNTIWSVLEQQKALSNTTLNKKNATVINSQIAVISDSKDDIRVDSNALSVCQAFRTLDEDNELVYKVLKKKFNFFQTNIGADINTFSTDECSNLIQIPARTLLTRFGISHVQTEESIVPEVLRKGYFCLGTNSYKGTKIKAYLQDDYDIGSYPMCIDGTQGAGKSTLIENVYDFACLRGEGGVCIDYIKANEMTMKMLANLPKEKVILLDYADEKCIQGFAYNEFANREAKTPMDRVRNANLQIMQFLELINVLSDGQVLQVRMRKYLIAAGTVVYCTGDTSMKGVVDCLEDYEARAKYISLLDDDVKPYLKGKIKILNELDEYSKPTRDNPDVRVIGTKDGKIDGILDRVSLLREEIMLEYMFDKGSEGNIDFAQELEKGKIILIKMLQGDWSARARDVVTSFFISKIWSATEIRGAWNKQPLRSHIVVDEIYQCPIAMELLCSKNLLPQTRKFGCKFIFTVQGLQQIKKLITSIMDAGGTFMFLKGTKEEDFNLLKNKVPDYEYEDITSMGKMYDYPSFNIVQYKAAYASFITELPLPPKERHRQEAREKAELEKKQKESQEEQGK